MCGIAGTRVAHNYKFVQKKYECIYMFILSLIFYYMGVM